MFHKYLILFYKYIHAAIALKMQFKYLPLFLSWEINRSKVLFEKLLQALYEKSRFQMLWSTQIYGYVKKKPIKVIKKPPSDVLIGISFTRYYDGKNPEGLYSELAALTFQEVQLQMHYTDVSILNITIKLANSLFRNCLRKW